MYDTFGEGGAARLRNTGLRDRLIRLVSAVVLGIYLALAFVVATNIHHGLDPAGGPLGADFSAFYEAARFAKAGHTADAYDDAKMIAAEHAAIPGNATWLPWNYPPIFQLLLLPFAFLPYIAAWALWSVLLYGGYALLARSFAAPPALWLLLMFPAAVINIDFGENGLLTTLLVGCGVAALPRRPNIAGILLALTCYKPHLAILVPFALAFGREWKALSAAIVAGLGFIMISALALGVAPWTAFLAKMMDAPAMAQSSSSNWHGIPSVLSVARGLGLGSPQATILHLAVAAIAFALVMRIWWRSVDPRPRLAALAAGALIVTPYLRVYDMALLIFPIAVVAAGAEYGPAPFRIALAAIAWLVPAIQFFTPVGVQATPLVIFLLLAAIGWPIIIPFRGFSVPKSSAVIPAKAGIHASTTS